MIMTADEVTVVSKPQVLSTSLSTKDIKYGIHEVT